MKVFPLAPACILFFAFSTNAFGDDTPSDAHLRGLELMVRPGLGAAPGDSPVRYQPAPGVSLQDPPTLLQGASPWGLGFVGDFAIGYRPLPLASFGMRGGLRTASSSQLTDGSTGLSRLAWDAGFYAHFYPLGLSDTLRRYLDPWVGVGVEYMHDEQSFQRPTPTVTATGGPGPSVNASWSLEHHAVAIPLGVGVDYRLTPAISVGPSFEYAIAVPVASCVGASMSGLGGVNYCSNSQPGQQVIATNGYGVWSVGLDLRATLF